MENIIKFPKLSMNKKQPHNRTTDNMFFMIYFVTVIFEQ